MMKVKLLILLAFALTLSACRGEAQKLNAAGNEAFVAGEYDVALEQYQNAGTEAPDLAAPEYNRANVYYRQTDFESAGNTLRTAMLRSDTTLTQHGQFNLGNTLFNLEDYAGAVEAYKQALRLDPQDMDAKVNLELALQKLAQQQQQEQEQEQEQENQEDQPQEDQPQEEQEQRDDPQGGQSDQNQEENSDPTDSQQEEESGEGEQQDNQDQQNADQNESQNGDQSQQPDQEQPGEEQDAGQGEQEEQQDQPGEQEQDQGQAEAGQEPPPPQPQQPGASGQDQQAEMLPGQGQPMQLQGLTEEQARQLLIAASQDTETLQEYLQQIYVFPFSEVQNDW